MSEAAAVRCFAPCQQQVLIGHLRRRKWKLGINNVKNLHGYKVQRSNFPGKVNKQDQWLSHGVLTQPKSKQRALIKNQMAMKPATYSSRMTTDIPLSESPGASFDRYLEDKPRVFKAIFPDHKRRSQRLNEEEWRVRMLPINFFFLTAWPVVDMRLRCKTGGRDYPPGVPQVITKVLELDVIRWELQGLDKVFEPSQFSLCVKGTLYPDRRGPRTRLRGQLEMKVSVVLPHVLALIPEDARKTVAESLLRRLLDDMKHEVSSSLLADYREFKRERSKNQV